jgi:hypothetical protein
MIGGCVNKLYWAERLHLAEKNGDTDEVRIAKTQLRLISHEDRLAELEMIIQTEMETLRTENAILRSATVAVCDNSKVAKQCMDDLRDALKFDGDYEQLTSNIISRLKR